MPSMVALQLQLILRKLNYGLAEVSPENFAG